MYGAMREHAPPSTRLAGVITASAITLAMGYALANGLGGYIVNALPEPMLFTPLPDKTKAEQPLPTAETLDTNSDARLAVVTPISNIPDWAIEQPPLTGDTQPPPLGANPGPAIPQLPPTPKSVRVAPKILPAESPPYPASEIRKNNTGTSKLEVCLDARGRVTSAALAGSSGHPVLDQAALKWVRNLKFTPLTVDGSAQPICHHAVDYEWRLDRR